MPTAKRLSSTRLYPHGRHRLDVSERARRPYGYNFLHSGGVLRHEVSPDVTDNDVGRRPRSEQAPVLPGLASSLVTNRHQLTVCGKVEAAGIAPASRMWPRGADVANAVPNLFTTSPRFRRASGAQGLGKPSVSGLWLSELN